VGFVSLRVAHNVVVAVKYKKHRNPSFRENIKVSKGKAKQAKG
jgi:hypothetical protein